MSSWRSKAIFTWFAETQAIGTQITWTLIIKATSHNKFIYHTAPFSILSFIQVLKLIRYIKKVMRKLSQIVEKKFKVFTSKFQSH